jgi:polysaccharide export outer membrane protein
MLAVLPMLASCVPGWLANSGPSAARVAEEPQATPPIPVIEVSDDVARRLLKAQAQSTFADALPAVGSPSEVLLGAGDVVSVSIWEAPPAVLFGAGTVADEHSASTSRATTFPDQMVAADGTIDVPFAGTIQASGKSVRQIEEQITKRLAGKANQPQALVSVRHNASANVTVVGEVAQSLRMPLTSKGERVLDALAAAGGVRQPLGKITIQLSRGDQVHSMALDSIIQDYRQNVVLQGGDVLAALYQPLSFTALGASGKNDEINFEAQGITLAQALGRMNGLQDARSDARGVFIFRFEEGRLVPSAGTPLPTTADGTVPVIYRMNLREPRSFLIAQDFPIRNRDVIYVANAPSAELQKFLTMLSTAVYSIYPAINISQ